MGMASSSAAGSVRRALRSLVGVSRSASKRRRGGGDQYPGGWFSEGTQEKPDGLLFGETPPLPGQARKWESWELPWYFTLTTATLMLTVGLASKPDRTVNTWAKKEAMVRRYGEAKLPESMSIK